MLSAATVADIERMLEAHEDSTSNQIAVLTIADLGGEVLEEYSLKVAETWKLGQAGKDNGVLLLVARDDRKVRIEVGRGLEGSLTDATSGRIIRREIVPRFKEGDFDGGVLEGTKAIVSAIEGTYSAEDESEEEDLAGRLVAGLIFLIVIGTFTFIAVVSQGFVSWFLFVFLLPFWTTFPQWILGPTIGLLPVIIYVIGFIVLKIVLSRGGNRKLLTKRWGGMMAGMGSGWSTRSGSFSSGGGGGFSGGGGSFSGGGSSGSW
jgi:uncharacterized protein